MYSPYFRERLPSEDEEAMLPTWLGAATHPSSSSSSEPIARALRFDDEPPLLLALPPEGCDDAGVPEGVNVRRALVAGVALALAAGVAAPLGRPCP